MIWVVLGLILGIPFGIWLGRDKMRPLPSFEDKVQKRRKEIDTFFESEKKRVSAEVEVMKLQRVEALYQEVAAHRKEMEKSIETIRNRINELLNTQQKKEKELANLQHLHELENDRLSRIRSEKVELQKSVEEYERSVVQTKIRILKNARYERKQELELLQSEYDELVTNTNAAIALIQSRMAE